MNSLPLRIGLGLWLLLLCTKAQSQEPLQLALLDKTHGWIERSLLNTCDRADRYFLNRQPGLLPLDDFSRRQAVNNSLIRLSPSIRWEKGGKADLDLRFDAKINLPSFKEQLKLVFYNEDEEMDPRTGERPHPSTRDQPEIDEQLAGLRFRILDETRIKTDFDVGMKFKPEPVPKVRIKLGARTRIGDWRLKISDSIFYESDDGFGTKATLDLARPSGEQSTFRSSTSGVWSEDSRGVDLNQSFQLSWRLNPKTLAVAEAGVRAYTEPDWEIDRYSLRFGILRQSIRDWLILEIEPGIDWRHNDQMDHYEAVPLITFRTHFLFGAIERWW